MLQGGLPAHSSTLLFGSPGSGKTLLGLHFLAEGVRAGETGLYFGFMETSPRLQAKAVGVGQSLDSWVKQGKLLLETRAAVDILPDALVHELLALVKRHGVRRVVVDGLESLVKETLPPRRVPGFLTALINELRSLGVTALMTHQSNVLFGPRLEARLEGVEAIVDNIIFLRYVELRSQLYRMLSILKMRESDYEPALREFSISTQGIDVAETFESAEAILTGQARPLESRRAPAQGEPGPARHSRGGDERRPGVQVRAPGQPLPGQALRAG